MHRFGEDPKLEGTVGTDGGELEKGEIFHPCSCFFTFYHPEQARNYAIFMLSRVGAFFEETTGECSRTHSGSGCRRGAARSEHRERPKQFKSGIWRGRCRGRFVL